MKIIDLKRVVDYDLDLKKHSEYGLKMDVWTLYYKTGLKLDKIVEIKLKTYHKATSKLKKRIDLDIPLRPILRLNSNFILNEKEL